MEDIRRIVNRQCVTLGELSDPDIDLDSAPVTEPEPIDALKVKSRICQNFNDVNKVSEVASTPQGDITSKQQRLAGHKYICVLDFAAGFYAIPVEEESQPLSCYLRVL